jgi:hypothetical protein
MLPVLNPVIGSLKRTLTVGDMLMPVAFGAGQRETRVGAVRSVTTPGAAVGEMVVTFGAPDGTR